jgi:hypothetical protein
MTVVIPAVHEVQYLGLHIKVFHANHGEGLPRHQHIYPHLTMCHSGSCVIRKEGVERVIDKHSTPINLRGGEWHEIEALENGTVIVNIFDAQAA